MFKKFFLLTLWLLSSMAYAQPRAERPLTVVLDWYINPDHAPLLVADEQGFFRQQGVQVKLIQPGDPMDGPKLVAAKKADIALTYQPQLLMQVNQGLPLVRFASLVDSPLDCLLTLKASGIQRIEGLRGKTIGYSSGGIDSAMLRTMFRQSHLDLKEVTLINVRYNLVQALLSKNVDAFTGAMRNVEPIQLSQSGHPPLMFYPEEHGFPQYEELIFVTHRQNVEDPRLSGFVKALRQGVEYLVAHPQESWAAAIKHYPELNNPVNKASWLASIQYFSKTPAALDKSKYQTFAKFMFDQGLISEIPKLPIYTKVLP